MTWLPAIIAVFVWWFATGLIMLAVRWADRAGGGAHGMVVFAGIPLLSLGVAAVLTTLSSETVMGVYAGFLGALAVWGWIELAFLAGVVTGPEKRPCPPGLTGFPRFSRAWEAVSHHEIALTLGLVGVVIATSGAANQIAFWTYFILYLARVSAKLNLFFGVPRINLEFIPARLDHLKSYFRRGPATPAFPIAITALTGALAWMIFSLMQTTTEVEAAAATLLVALTALALLEHWLMVVPLPDAKLWRWMLPAPPNTRPEDKTHGL